MKTYAYGFPRLGKNREYKKVIEGYWNGKNEKEKLYKTIDRLQEDMISSYKKYVDKFPSGEITLYDNMLDTAIMLGVYKFKTIDEYYLLCRGRKALTMTKWFNTNYHYLVPEIEPEHKFSLNWNKPAEWKKRSEGIPYLIGPFTFLKLSRGMKVNEKNLLDMEKVYKELIKDYEEVHIDEPAFVMDLEKEEIEAIKKLYTSMIPENVKVNLFTCYESVDFLKDLYELPFAAIGLDFINGMENFDYIKKHGFPEDKTLIAGVVSGRNIWRTDIKKTVEFLKELSGYAKNIVISNGAPLYHLPITVKEEKMDDLLLERLAFAEERLYELKLIADLYEGKEIDDWYKTSDFGMNENVQKRIKNLKEEDFKKALPYKERVKIQKDKFNLPLFPTTTIGSFPQTEEVRRKRADYRKGSISGAKYEEFIKEKISHAVKIQEELNLDVLVHGEFERTDMVEFFAEKMNGMARTKKGWIISYGTRCYRPPIIYGDISRKEAMTVKEIAFAQSLTDRPVKGMITGPVTILAWGFPREDIHVSQQAYQIGFCLQDEIRDYEKEGINIVQVDEPAFKEKAPIKKRKWGNYFDWAVKSFNLSTNTKPETMIKTHMCYSEFGEIMDKIIQMDFDVMLIEATRSRGNILESFEKINFYKQIGLGVWDIHSPAIPSAENMREIVKRSLKLIPVANFWLNPDCGLKTRKWEETMTSLRNISFLAGRLRQEKL